MAEYSKNKIGSQSSDVVKDFLNKSSIESEKQICLTRIFMFVAGWIMVAFLRYNATPFSWPRIIVSSSGFLFNILFSIWTLANIKKFTTGMQIFKLKLMSVHADIFAMCLILFPYYLWLDVQHVNGFLKYSDPVYFILLILDAGMRHSKKVAKIGTVSIFTMFFTLIIVDMIKNSEFITYGLTEIIAWTFVMVLSTIMGFWGTFRMQRFIFEAAELGSKFIDTKNKLGIYLSPKFAEQIIDNEDLKISGEKTDAVVLFTDLRDFTAYSSRTQPEHLINELNDYFDHMVEIILEYGGSVDKFLGDSIMAVFGVPFKDADAVDNSVACAFALDKAMVELNLKRKANGLIPLNQGIGLHYGEVIAGNVGNKQKMEYTLIGDTVNIAYRLETLTKTLDKSIIVSKNIYDNITEAKLVKKLDGPTNESVKGKKEPITIYHNRD